MREKTTNELKDPEKPVFTKGWTDQRRREQAARCRRNRPWEKSTGPKTDAGKDQSRQNALVHGLRGEPGRRLREVLRAQRDFVKSVAAAIKLDRSRRIPDTGCT